MFEYYYGIFGTKAKSSSILVTLTLSTILFVVSGGANFVLAQPANGPDPSSSQPNPDLERYTYFAGPDDIEKPEIIASGQKLVPWSETDKMAVRQAIADTFKKTPWLVAGSGWKHKLAFGRISRARASQTFRGATPYAFSGPGYVIFTNTFFAAENKSHALVHELVHVADCGNSVAYSADWVQFAQPTICKLRLREQLLTQKGWLWYNAEVRKRNIWPSLYGSENLKEGLAEYFTAYQEISDFSIAQKFKDKIAPIFVTPNNSQLAWRDAVTQALIQYKCKHYHEAIDLFLQAQKIDPSSPALDYHLAECYMNAPADKAAALQSVSRTLEKCNALKVAYDEPMLHASLLLASNLLRIERRFKEAIPITNKVLSYNLYDEDARFIRGGCENHDGTRGQSIQDIYYSKGCFGFVFSPLMGIESDPKVARLAVDEIVAMDRSGDGLWGRAQFFEQCAHNADGQTDKNKFYKLALVDYKASMEKDDTHKLDGLLRCADLNLKLGDPISAQENCTEAQVLQEDGLAAGIMQLKIWEATGDKRQDKAYIQLSSPMPAEQQMAELHDYNYLEPPSTVLDSSEWQKPFRPQERTGLLQR